MERVKGIPITKFCDEQEFTTSHAVPVRTHCCPPGRRWRSARWAAPYRTRSSSPPSCPHWHRPGRIPGRMLFNWIWYNAVDKFVRPSLPRLTEPNSLPRLIVRPNAGKLKVSRQKSAITRFRILRFRGFSKGAMRLRPGGARLLRSCAKIAPRIRITAGAISQHALSADGEPQSSQF